MSASIASISVQLLTEEETRPAGAESSWLANTNILRYCMWYLVHATQNPLCTIFESILSKLFGTLLPKKPSQATQPRQELGATFEIDVRDEEGLYLGLGTGEPRTS